MITIKQVEGLDQLLKVWPRLFKLSHGDNRLGAQDQDDKFLLLVRCFNSGLILLVHTDSGLSGFAAVEGFPDEGFAVLHSIPRDSGQGIGRRCVVQIKEWADHNGINQLRVLTTKLSGSNFKYFEDSLGFRRKAVTFTIEI